MQSERRSQFCLENCALKIDYLNINNENSTFEPTWNFKILHICGSSGLKKRRDRELRSEDLARTAEAIYSISLATSTTRTCIFAAEHLHLSRVSTPPVSVSRVSLSLKLLSFLYRNSFEFHRAICISQTICARQQRQTTWQQDLERTSQRLCELISDYPGASL